MDTQKKKIVLIVGSLRKGSLNKQLAEMARKYLEDQAECTLFTPSLVPLFDQDLEFPTPKKVEEIRQTIKESDGIWIFTPEYNTMIPGGLKNLLDWLSRPMKENDPDWKDTAVWEKKVTASGVAGRSAAKDVLACLLRLLPFMGMEVMSEPLTEVAMSPETMKTSDLSFTKGVQDQIKTQADAFLKFIENNKNA